MDGRAWLQLPSMYPEVLEAEKDRGLFWTRQIPILVGFALLSFVPAVQEWTGLSPWLCTAGVTLNALAYGGEVFLDLSGRFGTRRYTTFVITANFTATTLIAASPGNVAATWALYFVYVFIASQAATPSLYVCAVAVAWPLLAGAVWDLAGTSTWQAHGVPLLAIAVLAGVVYVFLGNYKRELHGRYAVIHGEQVERARSNERRALGDDLHDTLGAALAEVALWHDVSRGSEGSTAKAALERADRRLKGALAELRTAVATLHDEELDPGALERLLHARLSGLCAAAGVALDIDVAGDALVDGRTASELIKLVEEAASNAVRHGRPQRLSVGFSLGAELVLTVEDDGAGFALETAQGGNGLAAMRRRTDALGGVLALRSRLGEGTAIEVRLETTGDVS